jgi:hypothetical protein
MKAKQLIRESFRTEVFGRDGHKCRVCKKSGYLDAHHITDRNEMPNGGYVKENGISLCDDCHWKAERYHINGGNEGITGYLPEDLYKLIGSSKEKAIEASISLSK